MERTVCLNGAQKTICIKGVGKASVKPDLVVVSLFLDALDKDYAKAVDKANGQITELRAALGKAGFDKSELKTKNFAVTVKNKSVRDKDGNYTSVFEGYNCHHDLAVEFDFDPARLSDALGALSECSAHPQADISFTVKDKNAVANKLLEDAVCDAKAKAETIARASGVRLGEIAGIEYDWREPNSLSATRYSDNCAMLRAAPADFVPEDVKASDAVTVTWEIEK